MQRLDLKNVFTACVRRVRLSIIPALAALLLCPPLVMAGEPATPTGTVVTLAAGAETKLANDEFAVTFQLQAEGKDVAKLRSEVNRKSQIISDRIKQEGQAVQRTLTRQLEEVRDYQRNIRTGWRLVQIEEVVTSQIDGAALWLDAIEQAGAQPQSSEFRIRPATRRKAELALRDEAVGNFMNQARLLAADLRAPTFRVLRLDANSEQPFAPQPMMVRAMAMDTAERAPAPVLSSGETALRVNVRGEIQLPPKEHLVGE